MNFIAAEKYETDYEIFYELLEDMNVSGERSFTSPLKFT